MFSCRLIAGQLSPACELGGLCDSVFATESQEEEFRFARPFLDIIITELPYRVSDDTFFTIHTWNFGHMGVYLALTKPE